MTSQFQLVLFVVFTGFFVLIGLASLAVLMGLVRRSDERFRRWAIPGFLAGVTTAILGLFRISFLTTTTPIMVTLVPPPALTMPWLKTGMYEYTFVADKGNIETRKGSVDLGLGEGGTWQVRLRLSDEAAGNAIKLHLEDEEGGWWQVGPFFPNYVRQEIKTGKPFTLGADASWSALGVVPVSAAEPASFSEQRQAQIRFDNWARPIGERYGRAYYEWRVFVNEPDEVLRSIARVDYVLHPTFPEPFKSSEDRDKKFALQATGWGGFNMVITIHYTNGKEANTSYFLNLQKPWPAEGKATDRSPATPPAARPR